MNRSSGCISRSDEAIRTKRGSWRYSGRVPRSLAVWGASVVFGQPAAGDRARVEGRFAGCRCVPRLRSTIQLVSSSVVVGVAFEDPVAVLVDVGRLFDVTCHAGALPVDARYGTSSWEARGRIHVQRRTTPGWRNPPAMSLVRVDRGRAGYPIAPQGERGRDAEAGPANVTFGVWRMPPSATERRRRAHKGRPATLRERGSPMVATTR